MKMLALILLLTSLCFSRSVIVDLDLLPQNIAQKVSDVAKETVDSTGLTIEQIGKYTEMGKGVGIAVAELCKSLNVGVNEFAKTRVGVITMGILVWKLVGKDIWSILGGIIFLSIFMTLWWKSFKYFHISERIVKTGKDNQPEISYISKHDFDGDNVYGVATCHVIILIIIVALSLCLIFPS